jgi:hypothetical protein
MAENLIIGLLVMAACVVAQCVVVSVLLRALVRIEGRDLVKATVFGASWLLATVMLIMMAGNIAQMALWAWVFLSRGEFATFSAAFYHSVVNFATLGYGDVVMSEESRLLGALEAANGVLMFGLSTSVLFMVLNALMLQAWESRPGRAG